MLSESALAVRAGRITGTTAAGVLGVSPYETPLSSYQVITGLTEFEPNEAMDWGTILQPVVAARFAELNGYAIEECITQAHPIAPFLAASGDYFIVDTAELLEIKTASERQRREWGEPGSDFVPYHYLVQVVVQMAVYDAPAARVAVLFGGQEYAEYRVARDLELEREILERCERFYVDHLVPRVAPEATCPADMLDYLKHRYPQDNGSLIEATPEIEDAVSRLATARAVAAEAKDLEAEARASIEAFMGEAGELKSALGKITWKTAKPSTVVDWKAIAALYVPSADTIARFTTVKPGARSFRPYLKETPSNE